MTPTFERISNYHDSILLTGLVLGSGSRNLNLMAFPIRIHSLGLLGHIKLDPFTLA